MAESIGLPVVPSRQNCGAIIQFSIGKLEVCANVLNLLKLKIGVPHDEQCCQLLQGLVDLDAAVCLCLAIRVNILGIVLNLPLDLTLLLNYCHIDRVAGFTCMPN
ncbi:pEARLI1-like lipid transfer protein 1 [Phragmites australis]|uniref:pEARLI1-like lipid transfer protein 1 n=1 Tax=Phragmites australis TaxID=29695 RepID=UPI002D77D0E5|nr:pEARLI1-like lipid transfer protein 1 [Phragmites australis]